MFPTYINTENGSQMRLIPGDIGRALSNSTGEEYHFEIVEETPRLEVAVNFRPSAACKEQDWRDVPVAFVRLMKVGECLTGWKIVH